MDYISYLRGMVGHERVIMVVAGVLVFDQDHVLLQLRADSKTWGLPGGYMEMEESVSETAKREVREETGLRLGELTLHSIRSGLEMHRTLPSGDRVALVQIWFSCSEFSGNLQTDEEESLDARFFPADNLPAKVFSNHREIIEEYLKGDHLPIVD